jgi:hypothetical protein
MRTGAAGYPGAGAALCATADSEASVAKLPAIVFARSAKLIAAIVPFILDIYHYVLTITARPAKDIPLLKDF